MSTSYNNFRASPHRCDYHNGRPSRFNYDNGRSHNGCDNYYWRSHHWLDNDQRLVVVVPSGKFDVQVAHFEAVFAHADHEVDSDSVTSLEMLHKGRVGRVNKTEVFGIVMLRPLEWLNLVDLNRPSHDYEFTCSGVISLPLHL